MKTLRLLGSVGEPINPEAWMWYQEHIGRKRCPIVDTWWQTETGHDHDLAAARDHEHEAGIGNEAFPRHLGGDPRRPGTAGGNRRRTA